VGDCDSIRPEIRNYYQKLGSQVLVDGDQYSTDFGKTIEHARVLLIRAAFETGMVDIIIYGSLGGRVDQGLGLLGELLRETLRSPSNMNLWIMTESNLSWLMHPGQNRIQGLKSDYFTANVGIIPVYGPSRIRTEGLEYDVFDWPTEMGGNVSSNNHTTSDQVNIHTATWMLFTVERVT
jgi:thiamine pyrophosphokinase